jgi:hypothetical protein
MNSHTRANRGFTATEIVVIVVVLALLAFFGLRVLSSGTKTVSVDVKGEWTAPPGTIPAAPANGSFTYYVTGTPSGGTPAGFPGRVVSFTLGPSTLKGAGKIVSITDKNGTAVTIDAMTGEGTTDAFGNIVVEVSLESKRSANMVATDVTTAKSDPPIIFSAQ